MGNKLVPKVPSAARKATGVQPVCKSPLRMRAATPMVLQTPYRADAAMPDQFRSVKKIHAHYWGLTMAFYQSFQTTP